MPRPVGDLSLGPNQADDSDRLGLSFFASLRKVYAETVLKTQLEQRKKQGSYDAFKLEWHPVYEVRRLTKAHSRVGYREIPMLI